MGFVKVVKNKAYFKRFQTKFRRRREAKTDYYARKRLIMNDKNKYDTPKYRFVVRFTNKDVICQIFAADLTKDKCIAAAYGHELTRYGLKAGFNNFPATYCAGLLLARKVNALKSLPYKGRSKIDGSYYNIGDDENEKEFKDDCGSGNHDEEAEKKPFKAFLDVGLHRTTTGCRLFAAVKGACDGGLNVPHGTKRFPGTDKEKHETDFEVVKKYIFGGHVKEYMDHLKENDEDMFAKQFSKYIAAKIQPDSLEALYKSVHAAIRADAFVVKDDKVKTSKPEALKKGHFKVRTAAKKVAAAVKKQQQKSTKPRISVQQRKNRIKQILTHRENKVKAAKAVLEAEHAAANPVEAAAAADEEDKKSGSGSGSGSGSESD